MIEVNNINKSYKNKQVIKDISFVVEDGCVVGLLGVNGAGKSTMMNIISGYLQQDSGSVLIDGINMQENAKEAKKHIGYLPEIPPLYKDMKVYEYLMYVAELKKIKNRTEEVAHVIERFGLMDRKYNYIKDLSKGWQQRVGFAQALIGNPSVLLLDEPFVGLDPEESQRIRTMIKDISKEHCVVVSSHILREIEELCTKVLMIKDGTIVLDGDLENVKSKGDGLLYAITVKGNKENIEQLLHRNEAVADVVNIDNTEEGVYRFTVKSRNKKDIRDQLFGMFVGNGMSVYGIEKVESSLEEMFIKMNKGDE